MNESAAFATWAVELADRDLAVAAPLRTRAAVRAVVLTTRAWLCGTENNAEISALIARIPGAVVYRVDNEGRLFVGRQRLPSGILPSAPWLPLHDVLPVQAQVQVANVGVESLCLELVVSSDERPVAALLLPWKDLCAWVDHAPAHRFASLKIARRPDGHVLVLGSPLPPLRGLPLWAFGPALIPCGLDLSPAIPVTWLERALDLSAGDVVVIGQKDWQHIAASAITPLSRALVRSDAW